MATWNQSVYGGGNLISPYGKSKSVIVEASNYEQAQKVIDKEYPNHEVNRITNSVEHIRHFESMKKMKG